MSLVIGKKRRLNTGGELIITNTRRNNLNKRLFVVNEEVSAGTFHKTILRGSYPCTATGLRWDLSIQGPGANDQDSNFAWAVVITRDGNETGQISFTTENNMYEPEQDVLAYGCCRLANASKPGPQTLHFNGSTKSMRKIQSADQLKFVYASSDDIGHIYGTVQVFCKS